MACSDIKKGKLTPKMKLFAEYYVQTGNATQSYVKAYNKTYQKVDDNQYNICKNEACQLLKNEVVKEYIEELTSQRSPLAKEEWLIDKLLEIINDPNAKDSDKIRATETILKCLGAYNINQNINAKVEGSMETIISVTIEDDEDESED